MNRLLVTGREFFPVAGLRHGSRRRPDFLRLRLLAMLFLLILPMPLFAVVGKALFGDGGVFLTANEVAYRLWQTLIYVAGVVGVSFLLALPAAWATVALSFRGRQFMVWLLLLPFALPPYLTAYALADFMQALGLPAGGMAMAIAATALAVYPYVYFLARAALRQQHCHVQSAARLLGCSPLTAFWRVSLPIARPAIGVGAILAAMETLNDIAVAEYFGIQTLGAGIYDLWLNRDDLVGAARLSLLLLLAVLMFAVCEEYGRRRRAQYVAACDRCYECERAAVCEGGKSVLLRLLLFLPSFAGFWLPVGWLATLALQTPSATWWQPLRDGLFGSLQLSLALVVLLLIIGALAALDKRLNKRGALMRLLARLARFVYALPGTMLAQGVFILAAAVAAVAGFQLLAFGGLALLILASAARFYAIAGGALETGMEKIPPQLDAAAKLAALRPLAIFKSVHLPLLRAAATTAAIIIFMEGVKELPMTLILRPFNFDTLATIVYQYASDESVELAAPAALALATLSALALSALFLFEGRGSREGGPVNAN